MFKFDCSFFSSSAVIVPSSFGFRMPSFGFFVTAAPVIIDKVSIMLEGKDWHAHRKN